MYQISLIITVVLIVLMGIGGIAIANRWLRAVLWLFSLPLFCYGILGLWQGGFADNVEPAVFLWLICAVMMWPAVGCLIGEFTTRMHWTASILAVLYVSGDDEALRYDSAPTQFVDCGKYRGIRTSELSMLWAIMRDMDVNAISEGEFACLFQKKDCGRFIHRLPKEMVDDLSRFTPDRIVEVVSKWVSTKWSFWSPYDAQHVVEDLVILARRAVASGRGIYLWNGEKSS